RLTLLDDDAAPELMRCSGAVEDLASEVGAVRDADRGARHEGGEGTQQSRRVGEARREVVRGVAEDAGAERRHSLRGRSVADVVAVERDEFEVGESGELF